MITKNISLFSMEQIVMEQIVVYGLSFNIYAFIDVVTVKY